MGAIYFEPFFDGLEEFAERLGLMEWTCYLFGAKGISEYLSIIIED
jgi:hypothetical protein